MLDVVASQLVPSRSPPHNLEAERSVLGGVFIKPSAFDEVATSLQVDDFFLPAHREIFEAMLAIDKRQQPLDVIAVADELRVRGMIARLDGGEMYLLTLSNSVPTAENIGHYARLVKEKATLRRLIAACAEIQSRANGDFGDFEAFLDEAETQIFKVAQQNRRESYSSTGDLMEEVLHNLEVRTAERKAVTGVPTGFTKLDEITAGLQRENLIIVAARPGGGKTSWAVNVAVNAAMGGIPVLIFSLEMSKYELMERMLAGETRIDSGKIKRGFLEYSNWKNNIHPKSKKLAEAPILIDDSSAISIMEIRAKARRFRGDARYFPPLPPPTDGRPPLPPIGLIVVDYLQLARGSAGRRRSCRGKTARDRGRPQSGGQRGLGRRSRGDLDAGGDAAAAAGRRPAADRGRLLGKSTHTRRSIAEASATSCSLSPPASWVVSTISTRFHTFDHSGWFPCASASNATRFYRIRSP